MKPRDLRRYTRQTNARLLVGFFLIFLIVGIGLIALIWGKEAAVTGLICVGLSLIPAGLIAVVLWVLGWIARKANEG